MSTKTSLFQHTQHTMHVAAGQIVFEEGQPGMLMFVVQTGRVALWRAQQHLATAGPGNIVGEMALIDRGLRSATAIAETDCVLVPIDEQRFLYLVQQTPYFALHVMQVLVERLRLVQSNTEFYSECAREQQPTVL